MATYSGVSTVGSYVALPQAIMDVYSMDILHEAMGIMRYEEFAVKKTELSAMPGQTITMTRYNNLSAGGQLTENVALVETNITASQKAISVTEWGKAIGVSEKLLQMSMHDVLAESALLLGRNYAQTNDLMCRDALAGATQSVFAGNRATAALMQSGVDYFDVEMIRQGVEVLQTKNAPKFMGDFYVCFLHPHQAAYLKRDPDWVAAQNYAGTRALFNGELGRWEDVIFVGTTHARNGACSSSDPGYVAAMVDQATGGASNADTYEAILFADSAYGKATALPVELRQSERADYGRRHGLAWYAIQGAGILEDDFIVKLVSI
jgi:N4-gp56 family major capsid protein